jgi:maltose/moltooligosaccharide transporter
LAAVVWTVITTKEYPPEDLEAFRQQQSQRLGIGATVTEVGAALRQMPLVMRQLAWVQFFTWMGLFCMFLYFPPAVARNILGAPSQTSDLYTQGIAWAGICIATYNAVCFGFAFILPKLADRLGRKTTHSLCLLCGAAGLISLEFVPNATWILLSMVGVGIAWCSILAIPYAILIGVLPSEKTGIYMGIFNFFIVLPEIIAALGLGWVVSHWLGDNRLSAVVLGGVFMTLAALAVQRVSVEQSVGDYQTQNSPSSSLEAPES